MANEVPYKFYEGSTNGIPHAQILPGTNTPFGYREIDYARYKELASRVGYYNGDEFVSMDKPSNYGVWGTRYNYYDPNDTQYQRDLARTDYGPAIKAAEAGQQYSSGLSQDAQGNWGNWTKINAENAANEAAVAAGTMKKVPIGNGFGYIPTGSAADANMVNIGTHNTANAANTQTGVAVSSPTSNVVFDSQQALTDIYKNRSDLQSLYDASGNAKNPNDPKVKGIPTLQDWALRYGSQEYPILKDFAKSQSAPEVNNESPSTSDLSTGSIPSPTPPNPSAPAVTGSYIESATISMSTTANTLKAAYDQQIKDLEAKMKESQTKIDDLTSKQEDVLGKVEDLTTPFRATLEAAERERLYITKNFEENQKLTDELSTLLTEGNTLIKQQQGVTGLSSIRNPRINQTISDVTARAGVIQAVMTARNNQISQAYNMIDRSVAATNADRVDQLKYYSSLFDFYEGQKDTEGKKIVSLSSEEQNYIKAKIGLLENDLQESQKISNYIKELLMSPDSALAAAKAGITLNDSVQTINTKLAAYTTQVQNEATWKTNKAAIDSSGNTTQFVNKGGEIQRSADGYAFTSAADFQQKTGMIVAQAQAKGMISTLTPKLDVSKYPASYQEYLLAKQDGYNGSYNDYQTMDANRKAVRNTTVNNNTTIDQTREYDLMVKQAPSQVGNLKAEGKSWQDISTYFQKLGIDPGTPEIDDALHRAFQSQKDYEKWAAGQ